MTAPPRVLFVNHTSTISGAELVLLDVVGPWRGSSAYLFEQGALNQALLSRGIKVVTARWGGGLSGVRRDSNLARAIPLAGRMAATVAGLARTARRHDVLYANSQKAFVLASVAAWLTRRPLVWHLHDIIDGAHFGAAQRRLQVALANRWAHRVVVPSAAAARAFVASGGREDRVQVVANGLDLVRDPAPAAALREELGLPAGKLFGVFSRLAPWKGQHVAIEALASLPDTSCIIVGSALFKEDAYAAKLHALASQLGVANRVRFLGQRADVGRLMQAVDTVVHPSVDPEPFGRTLVEAMLLRTPVIATDAGAASEILEGGLSGILVPPGDAAALAAAIATLLNEGRALAMVGPRRGPCEIGLRRSNHAGRAQPADPADGGGGVTPAATLPRYRGLQSIPGWLPAALLVAGTAAAGPSLGSIIRPIFVLACGGIGYFAWRQSSAAHLQAVLILFVFSSFDRRLVDLTAGYEPTGLMLIGPLLAILAPGQELIRLIRPGGGADRSMLPVFTVGACVAYGTMLSMFQGDWMNAASGSLKWVAPLVYALALKLRGETGLAQAAARVFLVILPVAGAYGIYQYVDPPAWDRYWMNYASITSAGYPVPYGVRVFSTMNGPASFATFLSAGLLLAVFLRPGWQGLLLMLPAALALLLSLYRTAWLSLAAGLLFCLLFRSTRGRAAGTMAGIAAAIVVAGTLTPFGDVIMDRLATLGSGSQDGSGQERMGELLTLWNQPDSGLLGAGFTVTDAGSAGAVPIDGMLVTCWVTMGIVAGLICLAALIAAAVQAIGAAWRRPSKEAVVLGGLAAGAMIQLPLAGIASGELGFLYWTFIAIAAIEGSFKGRAPC